MFVCRSFTYFLIFVIKDKVDMTSLIRRLVPAFSPQQSFSRMNSVDSVSVHQLITVCLSGSDSKLGAAEVWTSRQALQDLYQKMLVTDLEYALDKKVEQDL